MKEQIQITITPRADCKICWSKGTVKGGSVPVPFGSGSCSLPDEFCDCVIEQIPDNENEYDITLAHPDGEQWEVIQGGNFLHVWLDGKGHGVTYAGYDEGMICKVTIPNYRIGGYSCDAAIKRAMPRAYKIAAAPEMFRILERALPIVAAEAQRRDEYVPSSLRDCDNPYYTEMRELANAITAALYFAQWGVKPEPPAEDYPETETDNVWIVCPHNIVITKCSECVAAAPLPEPPATVEDAAEDNMLAAELLNIAEAHRANFDDAESFREWAQSRARHTLNEYAKKKGEK